MMIGRHDAIEFYFDGSLLVAVASSHAPDHGDYVNIKGVTYKVTGRSWTVDHVDDPRERQMSCIVTLIIPDRKPLRFSR